MSILRRLFKGGDDRAPLRPLYAAVVARGRLPDWYRQGAVPDTLDGRFDMIAAILSIVLIRLEREGESGRAPSTLLTELFVDDMDGQLRQAGIGDIIVGKHIGKMMSALGGRITAYREALAGGDFAAALSRNLYRGAPPAPAALAHTERALRDFHASLDATPADAIIAGRLP